MAGGDMEVLLWHLDSGWSRGRWEVSLVPGYQDLPSIFRFCLQPVRRIPGSVCPTWSLGGQDTLTSSASLSGYSSHFGG